MASVFLSYAREDSDKAGAIALALEGAGQKVWWDSQIKGGAEYSREIERALEQSDAVVVLWSQASVASSWVRDEAAAGRDLGRLVPVRLDSSNPPLGFRQYQNIDLTEWSGRGKPPKLGDINAAIDRVAGGGLAGPPGPSSAAPLAKQNLSGKRRPLMIAAFFVAVAGTLWAWAPWAANTLPVVSVEAGDQSSSAKNLAADLLIKLGSLQTPEADALRLIEPGSDAKPDFTFKVGIRGAENANLALVDRDGALMWSREFTQPSGTEADLRQQIAYSAGQVLRCTTEALARDHPKLDPSVLSLYLKGCADLSATSDTRLAIPTFRTVTEKEPRFQAGWGKLLIAELEAFKATDASERTLQDAMRQHVAEARKVDPDLAEIYLVQSWLQKPRPILRWMRFADEAVQKKPNNAAILLNHATGLGHVGRMREAVDDASRASKIEPLSPIARQTLIAFLGDSGAYETARRELIEAERLWPGASSILQARFWFEFNYGEPQKALAIIESGKLGFVPSPAHTSFLEARKDATPGKIALAIADARKAYEKEGGPYRLIQTLAAFGRKDEVIEVLLSANPQLSHGIISIFFRRPSLSEVRRDPRFMVIAQRYGLIDYWRDSGTWPDFCSEPGLPYDCKKEAAKFAA